VKKLIADTNFDLQNFIFDASISGILVRIKIFTIEGNSVFRFNRRNRQHVFRLNREKPEIFTQNCLENSQLIQGKPELEDTEFSAGTARNFSVEPENPPGFSGYI